MTTLPKQKMTGKEFEIWAEQQPKEAGSFELINGEVVERFGPATSQHSEKSQHWRIKTDFGFALMMAIKKASISCFVGIDGPMVQTEDFSRFEPDVMVYCEDIPKDTLIVPNPIILVEVLSPGTKGRDHGIKLEKYFTLESVEHYLIIDPDQPVLIHHKKGQGDMIETRIVKEDTLTLTPPGLTIDLTEIFPLGTS